jgi:hypothetical protein
MKQEVEMLKDRVGRLVPRIRAESLELVTQWSHALRTEVETRLESVRSAAAVGVLEGVLERLEAKKCHLD